MNREKELQNLEKNQKIKEQTDLINELSKIDQYIYKLNKNNEYYEEIQNFIVEIINKYRYKIEVKNYYMKQDGVDDISTNQYETLLTLKSMLNQYILVKYGDKFLNNWEEK